MNEIDLYDLNDDALHLKIAKILLDYGPCRQYSVFEVQADAKALDRRRHRITVEVAPAEDSVRIYPICAACEGRIEIIGQGIVPQDPEFILI